MDSFWRNIGGVGLASKFWSESHDGVDGIFSDSNLSLSMLSRAVESQTYHRRAMYNDVNKHAIDNHPSSTCRSKAVRFPDRVVKPGAKYEQELEESKTSGYGISAILESHYQEISRSIAVSEDSCAG